MNVHFPNFRKLWAAAAKEVVVLRHINARLARERDEAYKQAEMNMAMAESLQDANDRLRADLDSWLEARVSE